MSKSNESYQKGFVIFFVIAIVVTLIVVFILRANATKSGTYLTTLSEKELETEGYGTYSIVNTSPCFTANGKCAGNGIQTVTSYCTPNPTTGYGCIDENGEQTFAPKTTQQNCLPNCRNTILQEQTNSYLNTCRYEQPYGDLTISSTLISASPLSLSVTSNSITKFADNGNPSYAYSQERYNVPFLQFTIPILPITMSTASPRIVSLASIEGNEYQMIFNYLSANPGKISFSINGVYDPLQTYYSYSLGDNFSIEIENNLLSFVQNNTVLKSVVPQGTQFSANFALYVNDDTIDNISFGYNGSEYLCIPRTAKTYNYRIFNCVVNDGVGENACSYTCGSDGRNSANVSGDSIVNSPSFIPACVGKKGQVITLNSLAGINLANLPKQGFKISKGYTVKNKLNTLGVIVPNVFTIDPPYYAPPTENLPIPIGTTEITRDELTAIDNSLVIYENCSMPSARVKPYCANYYYYQGTDVDSQITLINNNVLANSTTNFIFSKDCFNNPFWNVSSAKYLNPYNSTSSKYSLKGIGGFGLTYENYVCRNTPGNLELVPGTGTDPNTNPAQYYIPGALGGPEERNYCNPLTASAVDPPVNNTSCYDTLESIITMPLSQNKFYNICDVTYPDGSHPNDWQPNLKTPGLIQMCQYLPTQTQLDFDTFSESVNVNLRQFFGNFVQLNITDSGKTYFLGTKTSPCESTVSSDNLSPLTNCSYIKPLGTNYDINRATFIYDGGSATVSEAGNFWNKPGCDSEMIQLTSALNVLISPFEATVVSAPVGNKQTISANLYAYFGNTFGILLQNPFDFSLYFQPIQTGDVNKANYKPSYNQYFNIEFDYSNVNAITMKILVPTTNVAKFDGSVYSLVGFDISTTPMNTRVIPYNEYIKKSGLYAGQNVTVAASFQRNFACYATTCDLDDLTKPCFPKTCNLYYYYNADKC